MNNLKELLNTKNGKIAAVVLGIILLLLVIRAATPKSINILVNGGNECQVTMGKCKKKYKGKKDKKKKK